MSANPASPNLARLRHDRRLTPARPDLADERLRGVVSAERYVAGRPRRVVWPTAPLRREPRPDAPLETEALMGEAVVVYEDHEGWSWVQLGRDGYVGYLPEEALAERDEAPTHRVAALRTFVYAGPDLKSQVLSHLSLGSEAWGTGMSGDYVRLATGGFAWGGHLAPAGSHEPDFVAVAERLSGTPYLWGGKTSLGVDCSGLVQLALAMCGIAAPRDTDMQQEALGRPLRIGPGLAGLERGDLIFWRGHMGVMQDGTRLLHANGHHMAVASEPLAVAEERIRLGSYGPIVAVKRMADEPSAASR